MDAQMGPTTHLVLLPSAMGAAREAGCMKYFIPCRKNIESGGALHT